MRTKPTGAAGATENANVATAKIVALEPHPYAELFPMMSVQDLSGLREAIRIEGFKEENPIILRDGKILDGRNRYAVCAELGVTPVIKHFKGTDTEALAYVLRHNLHRRHLTTSQKALVAARLLSAAGKKGDKAGGPTQAILASQLSISERSIRNAVKLLREKPEAADAVQAGQATVDGEVNAGKAQARRSHLTTGDESDEWYTPVRLVEKARRVLGKIDLDPASCTKANKVVQATTFYTKTKDALKRPWDGNVFMNAPFSQQDAFCEYLLRSWDDPTSPQRPIGPSVKQAVIITTNATERPWAQSLVRRASAVCLISGRVAFIRPDGTEATSNVRGSTIWYLGSDVARFIDEYVTEGVVVALRGELAGVHANYINPPPLAHPLAADLPPAVDTVGITTTAPASAAKTSRRKKAPPSSKKARGVTVATNPGAA